MQRLPNNLYRISSICLLLCLICNMNGYAQLLKKLSKAASDVKQAAVQITGAAAGATMATQAVAGTVKTLKSTWKKDTSSNIRYQQIPDYRTREEVKISNQQALKVENGQFTNLNWEPVTLFENQVFPSFIIGWASYQGVKEHDNGSCLGFNIKSGLSNVTLKWEIECVEKKFFNIDSGFIEYQNAYSVLPFRPRISWNYRSLTEQQTSIPVGVYFRFDRSQHRQ
jgi:hypothetical protein